MPAILQGSILRFGDFELDCGRFELRRQGQSLRVERKPMELLLLLVSHEGQLVTRADIAQRLWNSEVFVDTEHGINTAIRKIRYILRDDSENPQFIQTVTGKGYRFVAPVLTVGPNSSPAVEPDSMLELDSPAESILEPIPTPASPSRARALAWYAGAGACVVLVFGGLAVLRSRHSPPQVRYTQITDFTDSAVAPALSPDGRMVAFIRGGNASSAQTKST